MKLHVALGFETAAAARWRNILGPPQKPSNWKQETFDAKLPELLAQQAEGAALIPLAGVVTNLVAARLGTEIKAEKVPATVSGLAAYIWHEYQREHEDEGIAAALANTVLYGVELRTRLRQLALGSGDDHLRGYFLVDSLAAPSKIDLLTTSGLRTAGVDLRVWYAAWYGTDAVIAAGAEGEAVMVARISNASGLSAVTETLVGE